MDFFKTKGPDKGQKRQPTAGGEGHDMPGRLTLHQLSQFSDRIIKVSVIIGRFGQGNYRVLRGNRLADFSYREDLAHSVCRIGFYPNFRSILQTVSAQLLRQCHNTRIFSGKISHGNCGSSAPTMLLRHYEECRQFTRNTRNIRDE